MRIFSEVLKKYLVLICRKFLKLVLKFNKPNLYFLSLYLISRKIKSSYSDKKIIIFVNGGGELDINAANLNGKFKGTIIFVEKIFTDDLFYNFFDGFCGDYQFDEFKEDNKANYEIYFNFIDKFVHSAIKRKIVGFFNFNNIYASHQAFIESAYKNNIKFVTYYKECLKPDALWDDFEDIMSFRPPINLPKINNVLVHNDRAAEYYKNIGYPKSRIKIVGQARSFFLEHKEENTDCNRKKVITYFIVYPGSGLPNFPVDFLQNRSQDEKNWIKSRTRQKLDSTIVSALLEYQKNNIENISLIFKGKQKLWNKNHKSHTDVRFFSGDPMLDLFQKSDVVIGFNTTAIIESVRVGTQAIQADLEFIEGKNENKYKFDFGKVVWLPKSKDELFRTLDNILFKDLKCKTKEKDKILERCLGPKDAALRLNIAINDIFFK